MPTGEERRGAVCGKIACTVRCRRREETRPVGQAVRPRRLPPTLPRPSSLAGAAFRRTRVSCRFRVVVSGNRSGTGSLIQDARVATSGSRRAAFVADNRVDESSVFPSSALAAPALAQLDGCLDDHRDVEWKRGCSGSGACMATGVTPEVNDQVAEPVQHERVTGEIVGGVDVPDRTQPSTHPVQLTKFALERGKHRLVVRRLAVIRCGLVEPGSLVGANGSCATCFDRVSPVLLLTNESSLRVRGRRARAPDLVKLAV